MKQNNRPIHIPLRFTEGTENIWSALEAIPRTGWVQWGIPNPENVAEHILATRELAVSMRNEIELKDDEFSDLLAIIEVHDWPEVMVGDLVIMGDERNVIALRNDKRTKEKNAMVKLCQDKSFGKEALALYERYESNSDLVAQYAKELDKLQAVILASEYERVYQKEGLTKEFFIYSEKKINIPYLRAKLEEIKISK